MNKKLNNIDKITDGFQHVETRHALSLPTPTNHIKPYTQYKPSGIAWLGDIPAHWARTCIKGLTKVYSEKGKPNIELLSVYRDYGVIKKSSRDDNHNKPGMDLSGYKVVYPNTLVLNNSCYAPTAKFCSTMMP